MTRRIVLFTAEKASELRLRHGGGWFRRNDSTGMVFVSSDPKKPGTDLGKFGVVWSVATIDDEKPVGQQFLFDQMLRGEIPGAVFLPINADGHVGLQKMPRPQVKDLAAYNAGYPHLDTNNLGRESWEVPRGFGEKGETWENTTDREVAEETGRLIAKKEFLGAGSDNTALSVHPTFFSYGTVSTEAKDFAGDPFEPILKKLTFFSRAERVKLMDEGTLYCDMTLSAIGRVHERYPDLLK
jgi:ADP-ribose pyrophosphatase YjhB (NUDIX family)